MAGNVIVGGLIGAIVDGSTGAMNSHYPNPLVIPLECEAVVAALAPEAAAKAATKFKFEDGKWVEE